MAYKTFEFVIPAELHAELKRRAKLEDMPLAQLVRRVLREYAAKAEVKNEEGKL